MARISLLAFRGIGGVQDKEHPFHKEAALVRAGHVALGGIIEGKLIGFSPSPEAVEKAGGEAEILNLLIQHYA